MDFSESLFIFEVLVEELKSYMEYKEFYIKSKFADVFALSLKDPNDEDPLLPIIQKKNKARNLSALTKKKSVDAELEAGQSILFTSRLTTLVKTMKNFPIELSLYCKDELSSKVGTAYVPWSPVYIDYLNKLVAKSAATPSFVSGSYNVYDNTFTRRVASIKLKMKLSRLKEKLSPHLFRSLTESSKSTIGHTGFNSKLTTALSTIKETPSTVTDNVTVIKTLYSGGKRKKDSNRPKINNNKCKQQNPVKDGKKPNVPVKNQNEYSLNVKLKTKSSKLNLVRSDADLKRKKQIRDLKSKSCSSMSRKHVNMLNYVFGDRNRPLGNRVFCVGYFTVENDFNRDANSSSDGKRDEDDSSKGKMSSETPRTESKDRLKFRVCDSSCPSRKSDNNSANSEYSLDLPVEDADLFTMTKCKLIKCNEKGRHVPPQLDEPIELNMTNRRKDCCGVSKTEEIVGGIQAKMKYDEDACFCTCQCTFGFTKRTTYCGICGGYEKAGEDMPNTILTAPFPCPIFHKLNEKKPLSASGSDKSKRGLCDDSQKSSKKSSKSPSGNKSGVGDSEKESSKGKRKRKTDDRFKFNYGYTAPQIGHSQCAAPCTGTMGPVPKNMGWLWTADNIPGLKFRPNWKPGATHKHVVHLLRLAKNPGIILAKKKKKDTGKKKKPLKRPLLTVAKKDGEYTVTMETMKIYPKTRALNQQPYEDKPVLTYTIGRTEEENRERQKRKEREQRRLERDQRAFIQNAFTDMCKEICLKTYQQALGILPSTEEPDCTCYPKNPGAEDTNLDHSCSCSEDPVSFGSDTDSDEWLVEFTPPNATFDPTYKGKKILKVDNSTQYTYLDYKVKLLDRYGNQVPRFFKGPDGKTQCSDLGGFWSPDHKWLEINSDGYIGPDEKWAPMAFIGPNGEQVDCDSGKFQAMNGEWLVVGVDGYIDDTGKWKFYSKHKGADSPKKQRARIKGAGDKRNDQGPPLKPSEATWSCFGDANPKDLSKLGILGHGQDKKRLLQKLTEMLEHGENVKIPAPTFVPRLPNSRRGKKRRLLNESYNSDRWRCKHSAPSEKGIVAVDGHGNKTYFRLKTHTHVRPKERLAHLTHQGISLSSFHVPCFNSFINAEMLKKQQYEKLMKLSNKNNCDENNSKNFATQYKYDNIVV